LVKTKLAFVVTFFVLSTRVKLETELMRLDFTDAELVSCRRCFAVLDQ